MIEASIKEKLESYKSNNNPETLLDLSLLNASVGNNEVSRLYINEYRKLSKCNDSIKISYNTLEGILDTNYHDNWENYRRVRNQNEKKRFAVTASLCKGDVLEIGCANGDLSSYISMYGHRLFGIDLDPVAIELARYKVWNFGLSDCFFNIDNANNLSIPDSSFDTVLLAEILEHIPDPKKALYEAKRVCKPNGTIILSVPRAYRIPSPDHLHVFNIEKLITLLKCIDVDEQEIRWDSRVPGEWILCWFYNKKDDEYINNNSCIQDYFIPPHPLETLVNSGLISIILPTYNGEAYIEEAIDSLLKQTYQNFELIVIDDGSTDKTHEKLKPYIDKGQIKYIYQQNHGKPFAINKGIKLSNGEYIWIFDDDDTALPRKLEVQMRHFLRNPKVDILHTSAVYTNSGNTLPLLVWEPTKIKKKDMLKTELHGCRFHGCSVIVKKRCYSKAGKWDERLIRAQDYDMWIRLTRYFESDCILIPTVTYRQHKKVRGSKKNPIAFDKVGKATIECEKIIFDKVYTNIPLEEVFPELKEKPNDVGLRVSALIERAYSMAKRQLFDYVLKDLKEAFDLAITNYPVALTYRGICYVDKFNKEIGGIDDLNIKKIIKYYVQLITNENTSNNNKEAKVPLTLSLCLITKDEEKNISRCINSVKDIVDEIVVVDTGSKDKTVEIAESFGAKVVHAKWEDDFSKARNIAIEHAKSDWILFLDADEEIKKEDRDKIRPLMNDDTVEAYLLKFVNYAGTSVSNGMSEIHYNFRLFRNNGKLKYVYPIHENLKNIEDGREFAYKNSDVTILHYGYLSETRNEKDKTQRYINMLSKHLLTHPGDKFQHGNLGVEYFNAGDHHKALKHLLIAIKGVNAKSSGATRLLRYLIQTYTALKDYDKALKIICDAKVRYSEVPDFPYLEGRVYVDQKRYSKAIEVFEQCLSIGEYTGLYITLGGTGSYRARYMIAFCYEAQPFS